MDGKPQRVDPGVVSLGLAVDMQRRDGYLLMADFGDYVQAQARVDTLFGTPARWTECVVANIAAMGKFSSDRTVREYVDRVWMPVRR